MLPGLIKVSFVKLLKLPMHCDVRSGSNCNYKKQKKLPEQRRQILFWNITRIFTQFFARYKTSICSLKYINIKTLADEQIINSSKSYKS